MALDKIQLVADLKTILDATNDPAKAIADAEGDFINKLADAIERYVKGATIVYNNGLAVPNVGVVVGTFNGKLQ